MKIAFYLPNKNISAIDFSNIKNGNPGIGGSEYSTILIATNLCIRKNFDVVIYCDKSSLFPKELKWTICHDLIGAIKLSIAQQINYLVVDGKLLTKEILCRYVNVHFIVWANTFISQKYQDIFSKMGNVIKIINVGKEQLELTKNHPIYKKSTYIYNAVPNTPLNEFPYITPNNKRNHNVCYIGSLHSAKGFQYLAQAWPKVIQKVPDANLFVIGSGRLYGRNAKLGKWGIADKDFEEEFMPYLTKSGRIIDSVHFLGILGNEKYSILEKCKVGVPNPSGVSETFGYTAVEMEMMGCQVTTIKCPGYIDTVCLKENLYDNTKDLSYYIIKLLNSNEYNQNKVLNYINQFSVENVISVWENFIINLETSENVIKTIKDKSFYYNIIRYYILRLKMKIKNTIIKLIQM